MVTPTYAQYSKIDPHEYGLHYGGAIVVTYLTTIVTNKIIHRPYISAGVGTVVATLANLGKELIYDGYLGKGTSTNGDIIAGTLGAVTAGLIITVTIKLHKNKNKKGLFN